MTLSNPGCEHTGTWNKLTQQSGFAYSMVVPMANNHAQLELRFPLGIDLWLDV